MKNLLLVLLFLLATVASASAQGCGAGNPNCVAPTPPTSPSCDNSTRIANTAFVHACGGGGGSGTLTAGSTPTSGFSAGQLIYSDGAHIQPYSLVPVPFGGTGAGLWSAGLPLIGNGGGALAQGTRSGNTTQFGTVSGSLTAGDCIKIDASGNLIDSGGSCGGNSNTPVFQAFSSPGAVTTLTLTNTPLPTSAGLVSITFDGRTQARSTWSINTGTGVITFTNGVPANTGVVEVDWWAPSTLAGVASLTAGSSTLTGAVNLVAGSNITLTPSGQNITIASSSAVSSVSNGDGTLTISPTTGAIVASLNTAHAMHFTAGVTVGGGLTADTLRGYADISKFGTTPPVCNPGSPTSTNVAAAVVAAAAAGWTHFFFPAGCFIYLGDSAWTGGGYTADQWPANWHALGEDWNTSGLSVCATYTGCTPAVSVHITMEPNSSYQNMFYAAGDCYNLDNGIYGNPAYCPAGFANNSGNGALYATNYPYQFINTYCSPFTVPGASNVVDAACIGITNESQGDGIYIAMYDATGSGDTYAKNANLYTTGLSSGTNGMQGPKYINGVSGIGEDFQVFWDGSMALGNSSTTHANGILKITDATASCTLFPATSTPGWACSSDRRLKKNIDNASGQLAWLGSFDIRQFDLRTDGTHVAAGVIAQEVKLNHPEMVHTAKPGTVCDTKHFEGCYSVDAPSLWRMMKAMQEMQGEIAQLRRKTARLR